MARSELPSSSPLHQVLSMAELFESYNLQSKIASIKKLSLKSGNVADAIQIEPKGLPHPVATATWMKKDHQHTISRWLLGNVAFHQYCRRCNIEVSRKHALVCSGAAGILRRWIEAVNIQLEPNTNSFNLLDQLIRYCKFDESEEDTFSVMICYNAIQRIREVCFGWITNKDGTLVYPGHPSLIRED